MPYEQFIALYNELPEDKTSINTLSLFRSDLIRAFKEKPTEELDLDNFKISKEAISKADQVVFVDNINKNVVRIFKHKYGLNSI